MGSRAIDEMRRGTWPDESASRDLAVIEHAPATLFRTDDPAEVVARATAVANELAGVVIARGLTVKIQGREYARVEAWTLLGSLVGVFPYLVWSRPTDDGWEARVEARTRAGEVIGSAEAMCTRSERTWASRDEYALRSMAQTRATSKALRQPLGFVMSLAGYEATPAEEMPTDADESQFQAPAPRPQRATVASERPAFESDL